ncbi:MAG: UUP1 family membrane protein [Alphaproteobacteria bacterium]|nr:UUP1 family membrane protein [Alphaproteobacteria bacterium]
MNGRQLSIVVGLLVLIGGGLFAYKVLVFEFPLTPQSTTETWRVDARITFLAGGGPAKVVVRLPQNDDVHTIVDQGFVSAGYGLTTQRTENNREAVFAIEQVAGEQTLYYRAVIHRSTQQRGPRPAPEPQVRTPTFESAELAAAQSLVGAIRRRSADPRTFAALLVAQLKEVKRGDEASLLLGNDHSIQRIASLAADLLQFAGIPARPVHGIVLRSEQRRAPFEHWLEFYADKAWHSYDPAAMNPEAPRDHLPWWRGKVPLVEIAGGTRLDLLVSVNQADELALSSALARGREIERRLVEYSAFGLPLHAQAVYRILLVVPVGVLLLVLLRNVVGIRTFGTFMPVLIALSFRQTDIVMGLALFCLVVALGLGVRLYFERLQLLVVPRLAAVVTVVIIIMSMTSVIGHKLDFEAGLSVALFPIVIMTMTIERLCIVWEEQGAREAMIRVLGSLFAAVLAYVVMNDAHIRHLVFVFPELLLVILAAIVALGRYTGYRLTELWRFRALAD